MGANRRTRRAQERAERKSFRRPSPGHPSMRIPPIVFGWEPEIEVVYLAPGEDCPICEMFGVGAHHEVEDEGGE